MLVGVRSFSRTNSRLIVSCVDTRTRGQTEARLCLIYRTWSCTAYVHTVCAGISIWVPLPTPFSCSACSCSVQRAWAGFYRQYCILVSPFLFEVLTCHVPCLVLPLPRKKGAPGDGQRQSSESRVGDRKRNSPLTTSITMLPNKGSEYDMQILQQQAYHKKHCMLYWETHYCQHSIKKNRELVNIELVKNDVVHLIRKETIKIIGSSRLTTPKRRCA